MKVHRWPTFTKFTSQMCIFFCGPKFTHLDYCRLLMLAWDRQSNSWMDDFDSIKWVKRTAHFERKHRSLFLLLASGMVLIKNSQITVPVFNIQARSSELFNKRGAHCQMSILAGCICVSLFLPASTCCCSDWGTKSSESHGECAPMGERMLTF